MITIKLPYQSTEKFQLRLKEVRKEYSNAVRYSYNRIVDGQSNTEILKSLNSTINNVGSLSGYLKLCAILEGKQLFTRFKKKTNIVFGGKYNFKLRLANKITKEEYIEKRMLPLSIQGDKRQYGNRHFNLNIIDENFIEFKLNRDEHFILHLPKIANNYRKKLYQLEEYAKACQVPYSIKLTATHIFISFEEFKTEEKSNYHDNRYLGIDMNPDTVGISVLEDNKVIHAVEYSLKPIFDRILNKNIKLSSKDDKMKYFQNKLKFETIQISKSISKLAKHYQCKTVYVEDLKFRQKLSKEQRYNNVGNRKNRNLWKRNLFIQNLEKRLNIFNIKLYKVNPAYSSFIGNLQNDYTDAINASIEIARRGYEYRILKNKNKFYPNFLVKHQWKETVAKAKAKDWKKLFLEIKNLKIKYRVSLSDVSHQFSVFSLNNKRSGVYLYAFD